MAQRNASEKNQAVTSGVGKSWEDIGHCHETFLLYSVQA